MYQKVNPLPFCNAINYNVGESSLAEKFQMAVISLLQENSLRRHHATLTRPPTSSAKEGEGALLRNDEGQNGGIDTFVTVYALGHTESSDFELSTSGCPILFGDGSSNDVGVEVDKCLPESNETTVEKEKEKERDKEEENKEKTTRVNVPAHGAASSMGDDGGTILTASLEDGRCPTGDNEEEEESDEMHLITNEMGKLHWIAGCIPFFLMHDLDLVTAIRELGRHLCALDRHKEALSIYTDLYDMHGRHFGWMHWDSLVFRFKRAQLLCVLGDNQLALDDCNELIAVCESKIDSEEDTEGGYRRLCLQVLNCIAETHLDSGLMEQAEETYSILLKKLIAERGECRCA